MHDVRFVATHGAQERVLSKYRDQLERKAKEEGHDGIDGLKEAYKDKITTLRKKVAVPGATAPLKAGTTPNASTSPFPAPPPPPGTAPNTTSTIPPPEPAPASSGFAPPGVRTLSSYLDIPKTLSLPHREIEYIWRLRHASDPQSLCAVMPSTTYDRLARTARQHPQFILPLPREGQGAEIHFLQWTFPSPTTATVLFTHLAEYKLRGEFSSPHTTVTHHLDLRESKGMVLLNGSVIDGRGVSVEEGKWLLMCLQKFYGMQGEERGRRKLLEQFTNGDGGFRVEELLEEAEKI